MSRVIWCKRCIWLACVALFPIAHVSPLAAQKEEIDSYVLSEMKFEGIPGMALGVYDHGKVIRMSGFGLANVELKAPVEPSTVFNSGSMAKQFVATAVMMLVQEGKVHLDDSITKYFHDAPPAWKQVEIKNLLSHTSGLGDYSTVELTGRGAEFDFREDITQEELRKRLYALPMTFVPGADWAYCNTNYVLLGMVIEKVTGEAWNEYLQQRIFTPLGMKHARLDSLTDLVMGRASGYVLHDGELRNEEWTAQTWNSTADGSLELSVDDMMKWDEALLRGKLLNRETLEKMWTVFPLNDGKPNSGGYGFGFFVRSIHGHRLIDHEGVWQGFHNYSALYVDDGIAVVVLSNLGTPMSRPQDIGAVVAGLYKPLLRSTGILPIHDGHPELSRHLEDCLKDLIRDMPDKGAFTAEMQAKFKDMGPARAWLKAQGAITSFQLVDETDGENEDTLRYRAKTSTRIFTFTFTLQRGGKIASMSVVG